MIQQPNTLLLEGPFGGVPPKPAYWKAVLAAKSKIGPILKEHKIDKGAGKKAGRPFSSVDDWIEQCDTHLQAEGLVFQQTATIEGVDGTASQGPGGRGGLVKASIRFLMVHAESATGMVYRMDWPLWGGNAGTSANEDTGAALSWACKYGLRGILFLAQAKDDIAVQQRNFERQQRREDSHPVDQEPVVQAAQEILAATPVPPARQPNPTPPSNQANTATRRAHSNGENPLWDPCFEDLTGPDCGWPQETARQFCAVPPNEQISKDLGKLFQSIVFTGPDSYFKDDFRRANEYWFANAAGPDTGFCPEPGTGKLPTGMQLRRYCSKLNWNTKRPARAGA